jgi:hypothetical protein
MPTFQQFVPPSLPLAPTEYDQRYIDQLNSVLRLYFAQLSSIGPVNMGALNIDIRTLPTQLALATLRSGDVYRDTTADNTLKIKP